MPKKTKSENKPIIILEKPVKKVNLFTVNPFGINRKTKSKKVKK